MSATKRIKVIVVSAWVGPREHFFDDIASAHEFAQAMKECQYKTEIEEIEENP